MGENAASQQTRTTVASHDGATGRASAIIVGIVALVIVLAIGWIAAGLPGLHATNTVSVALLLVALVSGSLTLIFVIDAVRRARKREAASRRDMAVVVICSLITAVVALIQLVQVIQQLPY